MRRFLALFFVFCLSALSLLPSPVKAAPDSTCIGTAVAKYMNEVITGVQSRNLTHIHLLSPAFNIGSYTFPEIAAAMNAAGANWAGLEGIAANAYNLDGKTITDFVRQGLNSAPFINGKPVYLTEIGMIEIARNGTDRGVAMENLRKEILKIQAHELNIRAGLLFDSFGTNPDYSYNFMDVGGDKGEIRSVCNGSCTSVGINSAVFFHMGSDYYDRAKGLRMEYSLEIANRDSAPVIAGINMAAPLRTIIRIGVGSDSGGFTNASDYVDFLSEINANGVDVFAIAGPNEPDAEYWASPNCAGLTTALTEFETLKYPCDATTNDEFHPLRPYPASPCDPLIPRKIPEAPLSTDPVDSYLSFDCAKSLNVSGTVQVKNVIDICGMNVLPTQTPLDPLNPAFIYNADGFSQIFLCVAGSNEICQIKRINWTVSIDLSTAILPVMGDTENSLPDVTKVNTGMDWYLNGTIYQSEKLPLVGLLPTDINRIVNYSGPVNKLMPKDLRNTNKVDFVSNGVKTQYHDYLAACQKDIDYAYVADVLFKTISAVFSSITDILDLVSALLSWGIDNLGHVGRAMIRSAQLPSEDFYDPSHAKIIAIFQNELGAAWNNNVSALVRILRLGATLMGRVGVIAEALRLDLAESCATSGERWRLSRVRGTPDPWVLRYVPYATLEDTTSEVTVSIVPGAQPGQPEIDGQLLSVSLFISAPSDSRLYFPHMKSAVALSELLNAFHTPITTPTPPYKFTPTWASQQVTLHQGVDDVTVIQRQYSGGKLIRNTEVIENQTAPGALYNIDPNFRCDQPKAVSGPGDHLMGKTINGTLTYYQLFRWTPLRDVACAPGTPCPAGPIRQSNTSDAPGCIQDACKKEGEECGSRTAGDSSGCCYTTCKWVSQCYHGDSHFSCYPEATNCNDPNNDGTVPGDYSPGLSCAGDPSNPDGKCCSSVRLDEHFVSCRGQPSGLGGMCGTTGESGLCGGLNADDCSNMGECCTSNTESYTPVPRPPSCPTWPNTNLKSAARVNPFTKTPFVEKLYDVLVNSKQSLLHRWLPKIPLSPQDTNSIKNTRDDTIPVMTGAAYNASTGSLNGPSYTAGNGGPAVLYFPFYGSLSNHILGAPTSENYNLQRIFRPQGYVGIETTNTTAAINCDQSVPDYDYAALGLCGKISFTDIASRWLSGRGHNYGMECYNDTIRHALATGINPKFLLWIWLHESGASNYTAFSYPIQDFGINSPLVAENDWLIQITEFEKLPSFYASACGSDMNNFIAMYWTGHCYNYPDPITIGGATHTVHEWVSLYLADMNASWNWIACDGSTPKIMDSTAKIKTCPTPLRVMSIGDSLTEMHTSFFPLDQQPYPCFIKSLTNFEMVSSGGEPNRDCIGGSSVAMDGYGGATTQTIINKNVASMVSAANPDAVIVFLGTNDCDTGVAPATVAHNIQTIVDAIHSIRAAISVYVALIPPWSGSAHSCVVPIDITDINSAISSTVTNAVIVDQYGGFNATIDTTAPYSGDLWNVAHPNASGSEKMARKFISQIACH